MQDTGGWEKVQNPDIYSKTASGHAQVVWQTKQMRSRQKTKIIKQPKRSKTRRPVGNTKENISYGERFEE